MSCCNVGKSPLSAACGSLVTGFHLASKRTSGNRQPRLRSRRHAGIESLLSIIYNSFGGANPPGGGSRQPASGVASASGGGSLALPVTVLPVTVLPVAG